jgi:ABC-type antimicrobial peptide transport system permease subunit
MLLLACAAAMALTLSAVGIYGVMSYLVTQRHGEIGIRIALGSPVSRVLGLILGDAAQLILIGLAVGLAGALAGTRLLRGILFGVSPLDPLVLGLVPAMLTGIALLAAYAPARRASRVDPVEALRG